MIVIMGWLITRAFNASLNILTDLRHTICCTMKAVSARCPNPMCILMFCMSQAVPLHVLVDRVQDYAIAKRLLYCMQYATSRQVTGHAGGIAQGRCSAGRRLHDPYSC